MRKKRSQPVPVTAAFRQECVALMERDTRTYAQLGRDLGVSPDTLRSWYNIAMAKKKPSAQKPVRSDVHGSDAGARAESSKDKIARLEREVKRLEHQVASLEEDKEILKKAAAFFAKESG